MHAPAQSPAEKTKQQSCPQPTQLQAEPQFAIADNRPEMAQLKSHQVMMGASSQQQNLQALQTRMAQSSQLKVKPNNTGLPDNLKSGVESLSGMSMDHVKVHYNSDRPAQLNAHAYAQGGDIHVAPGQVQHLPHEAWHVVQQAQGRVRPTMQMKGNVPVNDDVGLEAEADVMGAKALGMGAAQLAEQDGSEMPGQAPAMQLAADQSATSVVQRLAPGGADYTLAEKRSAIAHAKVAVTKKSAKTKDYAAAMAAYLVASCGGAATAYAKAKSLEKACGTWWDRPSLVDDPVAAVVRTALVGPTITYDTAHGDLHFIAEPTDTKSAWTLVKTGATALMETEIGNHLAALGKHSAAHEKGGWSAFYITAQHNAVVGSYTGEKKKNKWPTTDHYTMQVQVNYTENKISYHGFPDERIEGHPLGCSINKTDAKKLT